MTTSSKVVAKVAHVQRCGNGKHYNRDNKTSIRNAIKSSRVEKCSG